MVQLNWSLRPSVWFAVASMITTSLHELMHALAACSLGMPATLFNYSVDLTQAHITPEARALIAVSGPLFCLAFGLIAGIGYHPRRPGAATLPLLYLTVFGVGTFFGNLMSAPFVGDFAVVAITLHLPMPGRYALGVIGASSLAVIHFWAGRELTRWAPTGRSRVIPVLGIIVLPVVLGTTAVILVNLPMPPASIAARIAEGSFWLFAVAGAMSMGTRASAAVGPRVLGPVDWVAALLAVVAVRLMAHGIHFGT